MQLVILCAEQMQNKIVWHFVYCIRTQFAHPLACMTRNRYLAQDMWRLEDKVEGSERFTASGGSERTRENLLGLDGVSARDDDDGDEEEERERALSAMHRNKSCMMAAITSAALHDNPRLMDGFRVHLIP